MFQINDEDNIEIRVSCSITFFFENRAIYEIMLKNTVESEWLQMAIWLMWITWWVPKATNRHSQYVM